MGTETTEQSGPDEAIVHTPGPWYMRQRSGPGHITSEVCYGDSDECITDGVYNMADARLIAAAPDLLEALEDCLACISWDELSHGRLFSAGNAARDAIEKATGVRPSEVV